MPRDDVDEEWALPDRRRRGKKSVWWEKLNTHVRTRTYLTLFLEIYEGRNTSLHVNHLEY